MVNIIIDWDTHGTPGSEMDIIDIYPTNLIEIPLNEFDLADYAYYEALESTLNTPGSGQDSPRNR